MRSIPIIFTRSGWKGIKKGPGKTGTLIIREWSILFNDDHLFGLVGGLGAQLVEIDTAAAGFAIGVGTIPANVVAALSNLEGFHKLALQVVNGKSGVFAFFHFNSDGGAVVCLEGVGIGVFQLADLGINWGHLTLNADADRTKEFAFVSFDAFQVIQISAANFDFVIQNSVALRLAGVCRLNQCVCDQDLIILNTGLITI